MTSFSSGKLLESAQSVVLESSSLFIRIGSLTHVSTLNFQLFHLLVEFFFSVLQSSVRTSILFLFISRSFLFNLQLFFLLLHLNCHFIVIVILFNLDTIALLEKLPFKPLLLNIFFLPVSAN